VDEISMMDLVAGVYEHSHKTHKLAWSALRQVAKDMGINSKQAGKLLTEQDVDVTILFWEKIRAKHGDKYRHVWHCPGCQKFSLT
jgi:hypothetical protein